MYKISIISMYLPPKNSGAGKRAWNFAKDLSSIGLIENIICKFPYGKGTREVDEFDQYFKPSQIRQVHYSLHTDEKNVIARLATFVSDTISLLIYFLTYNFKERRYKTIYHCFGTSLINLVCAYCAKLTNSRSIIELTMSGDIKSLYHRDDKWVKRFNKRIKTRMFESANAIIGISPTLMKEYDEYCENMNKIRLIPNYVDRNVFSSCDATKKIELRNNYQIESNTFTILFVGGLFKRKGIDDIIKIIEQLGRRTDKKICFIIVGENNKTAEQINYSNELAKVNSRFKSINVILTGQQYNISSYYKIANVFLFPSKREGLPNVVLEAMSSGLPVIMNEIDGLTDYLIDNEKDGWIIKDDINSYVVKLLDLIKNPSGLEQMSLCAKQKIESRFSKKVILDKYLELYDNLAAS